MYDFKKLSKKEFLESYNYLTEAEYDNTAKELLLKLYSDMDYIDLLLGSEDYFDLGSEDYFDLGSEDYDEKQQEYMWLISELRKMENLIHKIESEVEVDDEWIIENLQSRI